MAKLKLIVGLGNPGQQYAPTRHNAGFWFIQRIANDFNITLAPEKKFHGLTGCGNVHGVDVRLLLPETFMNSSGQAVVPMMKFYDIRNQELLIAHDELDLPSGQMRLKYDGGHGGHNGLRDIVPHIGNDFYRLRLGIGHPGDKKLVLNHVLGKPTSDEQIGLERMLDGAMQALPDLVNGKMDKAQQMINGFKLPN